MGRKLRTTFALAMLCGRCAGATSPLATCLNASRRLFLDTAQLRLHSKPERGGGKQVYAFDVLDDQPTACSVHAAVNTRYAIKVGMQGAARPDVQFDLCFMRKQIRHLRQLPSLFWNGTAPVLSRWKAAIASHDNARRFVDTMVKAYVAYAARAQQVGVATVAVQREWRPHKSCAVVGGAPSLMAAELGAEIDAHEAVIRFNDHPTGGPKYTRFVGNRTTYLLLNALHAGTRLRAQPERRLLQIAKNGVVFERALRATPRRYLIEPEVYRTLYENFGTGGLTGNIGVWFALAACKRVSLYGFSSPCDLGTKYQHYYQGAGGRAKYQERVQVNTVKVTLWLHAMRCAGMCARAHAALGSQRVAHGVGAQPEEAARNA
ncbi:hypothetical protein KFE25_012989 [Diacronema lutheri]|uniref:beta-galactoside alpha-(2,6)-sialyltransferase n=1 Tax=Diacronema lutheri TaxID=2081491 RepID=A0A8J6C9E4_DIALT|nr:hypothetical protein KFE25_012989 [Diacronema lutheri]